MAAIKGKAKLLHADPIIAMLAQSYRRAFRQAESDDKHTAYPARVEIVATFSPESLRRLREQALVSWNPEEVIV